MDFLTIITDVQEKGRRLDHFLKEHPDLKTNQSLSRERLKNMITNGHILVNNASVKPSYKIKGLEEISISFPPPEPTDLVATNIPLDILHEDDDILIVNKQAGLTVHPAPGHYDDTLVNALLYHASDSLSLVGDHMRPGIVHRLDKDTSGVMVTAKTDAAHLHLSQQFADHSIARMYHGICYGSPQKPSGTIQGNIARHPHHRQKMALHATKGKPATTHYKVLKQYVVDGFPVLSLVAFTLETGRTHQIRVHATHHHFPLVGDPLYGGIPPFINKLSETEQTLLRDYPYQALHARSLGLIHPTTKEEVSFETDYPEKMRGLMAVFFN